MQVLLYLLSCRGKRPIDCPAQGNRYNTVLSERRDDRGVGTVNGRTLTYPPRFQYLGEKRRYVLKGRTRKRFCKRNARGEIRTRPFDDAKCEGVTY